MIENGDLLSSGQNFRLILCQANIDGIPVKKKYVFSQCLSLFSRYNFNYLAWKHSGNKYVKRFTYYN
ncbi:MAG: DUF4372 domain-containing protein [Bacteroidales bacterium]|nr:DUF4372 domain-containing protein [Bacteroidales bacterium]